MPKTTLKLDRLSNYSLTIGLKGGAILSTEANSDFLTSSKLIKYATLPTFNNDTSANTLVHKKYADDLLVAGKAYTDTALESRIAVVGHLRKNYSDNRLTITQTQAYNEGFTLKAGTNTATDGQKYAYFTGQADTSKYADFIPADGGNAGNVITAIKVDEYGTVVGVDYKKISTADLDNTGGTYDNYVSWGFKLGGATDTYNVYGSGNQGDGGSASAKGKTILDLIGSGITITYDTTATSEHKVTFTPVVDNTYIKLTDSKISHVTQEKLANNTAITTATLLKGTIDAAGHITGLSQVAYSDLSHISQLTAYSSTNNLGLVNRSEVVNTANLDTGFYTVDGTWAKIPYASVAVAADQTTGEIGLVGASGTNITTLEKSSKATINPNTGAIKAYSFSGIGSGLTSLNAANISSGTLSADRLPTIPANKLLGADVTENSILMYNGTAIKGVKAGSIVKGENYVLTQGLDSQDQVTTEFKDISTLIGEYIQGSDAMIFKGTIGAASDNASLAITIDGSGVATNFFTEVTGFKVGYTYKAVTRFSFADGASNTHTVEVGDILTAIQDAGSTDSPKFVVTQANIDGAVTFTNSQTAVAEGELAVFANTKGTVIKGAGSTIKILTDATGTYLTGTIEKARALNAAVKIWGNDFDGSAALTADNTIQSGHIEPVSTETYNIGTAEKRYNNIYSKGVTADTFTGALVGNADTATTASKVANTLTIGTQSFDGSQPVTVNLGALGGVSDVAITQKAGETGLFITGIAETSPDGAGAITFEYTRGNALTEIAVPSFLNVTNEASKSTISVPAVKTTGKLYLSGSTLGYGGTFKADNLQKEVSFNSKTYTTDALTKEFASSTASIDDKTILVADVDTNITDAKAYKFKASSVKIATTTSNSDAEVPTGKAVQNYVTNKVSELQTEAVRTVTFDLTTNGTISKTLGSSQNIVIRRVVAEVVTPLGEAATLSVSCGSGKTTVMSTADSDLNDAGIYIVDCYTTFTSNAVEVTVAGASATGKVYVHLDYAAPTVYTA